MAERRMDLKEAAGLLGLTVNGVRAQAVKRQIRAERGNDNKWFVYLDPEQIANDKLLKHAKKHGNLDLNEGHKKPDLDPQFRALEQHIETLSSALKRAETDADEHRAEAARLRLRGEEQADALRASEVARAELAGQVGALAAEVAHAQQMQGMIEARLAERPASPPPAAAERPAGLFGWLGRGKRQGRS